MSHIYPNNTNFTPLTSQKTTKEKKIKAKKNNRRQSKTRGRRKRLAVLVLFYCTWYIEEPAVKILCNPLD